MRRLYTLRKAYRSSLQGNLEVLIYRYSRRFKNTDFDIEQNTAIQNLLIVDPAVKSDEILLSEDSPLKSGLLTRTKSELKKIYSF